MNPNEMVRNTVAIAKCRVEYQIVIFFLKE